VSVTVILVCALGPLFFAVSVYASAAPVAIVPPVGDCVICRSAPGCTTVLVEAVLLLELGSASVAEIDAAFVTVPPVEVIFTVTTTLGSAPTAVEPDRVQVIVLLAFAHVQPVPEANV
jgi:hypothetical protein